MDRSQKNSMSHNHCTCVLSPRSGNGVRGVFPVAFHSLRQGFPSPMGQLIPVLSARTWNLGLRYRSEDSGASPNMLVMSLVSQQERGKGSSSLLAPIEQWSQPLHDAKVQEVQRIQHTRSNDLPPLRHKTLLRSQEIRRAFQRQSSDPNLRQS